MRKLTLSALRRLAVIAKGSQDAATGAELRAYVNANVDDCAYAFGVTVESFKRGIDKCVDDATFAESFLGACNRFIGRQRDAKRNERDEAAESAAARVSALFEIDGCDVVLPVDDLAKAAIGVERLRFIDAREMCIEVDARMVRDILRERDDALALLTPNGLEVQWGARGRLRFADLRWQSGTEVRNIHVRAFAPPTFNASEGCQQAAE